ncbi:hypothetical protein U6B65_02265 [Oscillospiraceae bacterium MB08-C2-2]|nr:hypothetical protein U6B65_02265 [Oscillospiraceae bacterium MB08-C2-2]
MKNRIVLATIICIAAIVSAYSQRTGTSQPESSNVQDAVDTMPYDIAATIEPLKNNIQRYNNGTINHEQGVPGAPI